MRDHISAYETAINKGLAKGHSEGLKEERIQTARRMKTEGLSIELITKITGLSTEEIASL